MKKILIATEKPFAPAAISQIKEVTDKAGYELILLEKYTDVNDFKASLAGVDALIVRSDKVTPEVLESADNLKIVVRAGAGYDNVDLDAATKKGIVVMNTPGQNSNAVAELALGMMVYQARNGFNGKSGSELAGKTIGIHAFGNVGKLVAKIAKGFGMKAYAFDPFIDDADIKKCDVIPVGSEKDLYSMCQYISLHIPANEKTKKSINMDLLGLMPQGATLVNTARKEVVCEESLIKMFETRADFSYISDIAPDNKDVIEGKFPGRYFFTPKKMGAQTEEANINAGIAAAEQIVDFLEKGIKTFQVN